MCITHRHMHTPHERPVHGHLPSSSAIMHIHKYHAYGAQACATQAPHARAPSVLGFCDAAHHNAWLVQHAPKRLQVRQLRVQSKKLEPWSVCTVYSIPRVSDSLKSPDLGHTHTHPHPPTHTLTWRDDV